MSKLNKDILFLIFEELQDDSKSLFSCLMVNRRWCETVIPILWRNPWKYHCIKYFNKNYLFTIIASYISNDIKEYLTRLIGIQLPLVSYQSLLFDYLSFCRSIDIRVINSIICIRSLAKFLQQGFYGLFMKKCSEIKYFNMRSLELQIFYFPESKLRFESLYELICDTSIDISYFYGLARICQHIQKLIIVNNRNKEVNLGIVKLIEVQKNLKHFEWADDFDGDNSIVDPYKEVLLTLEKKADTIEHLNIYYLILLDRTLHKVLPKLHKLKTLVALIIFFETFSEEQLKMCVYRDLEILKIYRRHLKTYLILIENSGGLLKKIIIDPCGYYYSYENFNECSLIFIRKIYENCPLIEYLSLVFSSSKQHFIEFEKLLNVCQNLKTLFLITCDKEVKTNEKSLENGKEVLNTLIRSAPTNLREIRFYDHIKFSLEALEEFLRNWKGRPLSILTSDLLYNGENYVKLINKYKNNGVIKCFRYVIAMDLGDTDLKI